MDSSYSDTGYLALLAAFGFLFFLFAVAFYVIGSWFLMKIFDKAGVQGRWRAWVPVYNLLVFAKLGDLSPWVMLIAIAAGAILSSIPVLGFIIALLPVAAGAMAAWRVGQKLQKETPWVILYVLLSIVWLGINAFDKSRWNPNVAPAPWASNGFFADRTVWQGIPVQPSAGAAAPQPGYQAPPAGYQPPAAPPAYQPPAAPPAYQPPPAPPAAQPPAAPPVPPVTPPTTEPPAPPAAEGDAPKA
ncbi:DUF5684 domain-containing protein [Microbacterium sp.]|uniref:DUF5684 domain-containing protein n=1 Tax=Microbacterium sp. TaxID=51671 RepID=UPI0025F0AE47|nr:DUF5684 domain-containing protein [Microbacterium sp.]